MAQILLKTTQVACERDDRLLFSGLNWQAQAGQLWQLTGPNGAGKTSLLNMLAGLLWCGEGKIEWNLTGADPRMALGYIGHLTGLRDELTAQENLHWLAALHGETCEKMEAVLHLLGLRGYTDVPLAHLSAGQKRRVALSRLWLSDKRVWLLDEPFTAIDAKGVTLLEQKLIELVADDKLVIYTSHHRVNNAAHCVELGRCEVRVA